MPPPLTATPLRRKAVDRVDGASATILASDQEDVVITHLGATH
jgi:hypothetical protein